jgi:hypothetical protein
MMAAREGDECSSLIRGKTNHRSQLFSEKFNPTIIPSSNSSRIRKLIGALAWKVQLSDYFFNFQFDSLSEREKLRSEVLPAAGCVCGKFMQRKLFQRTRRSSCKKVLGCEISIKDELLANAEARRRRWRRR